MNQTLKDKFARYTQKALEKGLKKTTDSILLAEEVVDALEIVYDMANEESGIVGVPSGIPSPTLDAFPPPPSRGAVVPHKDVAVDPDESGRMVLMPGDKGFGDAAPPDADKKVFSAPGSSVRRRVGSSRRPSNLPDLPRWEVHDLITLIDQNTPPYIEFEPKGLEGKISLRANKNVLNQAGMGSIMLTYKVPGVGDDIGGGAIEGQAVSLGLLTARVPFSVYDETQDVTKALETITAQLKGAYKNRGGPGSTMEPTATGGAVPLGSGGLRFDTDSLPMGDYHEEHFQRGLPSTSDPRADRGSDTILQGAMKSLANSNTKLVPPGRGLK